MVTFAIDPRKSAVVAVDLQNCNVEKSPIAAPLGLQVVDKLNLLAAHYRAAGSTIIWTRHAVRPDHSVVGGGMGTNLGCDATGREAQARGFKVLLLGDGTGTRGVRDAAGGTIPADE